MTPDRNNFDVIVIGAGAAGFMAAIQAGKRGRKVLRVDHSKFIGEKIRISDGGRCNFTNVCVLDQKIISLRILISANLLSRNLVLRIL